MLVRWLTSISSITCKALISLGKVAQARKLTSKKKSLTKKESPQLNENTSKNLLKITSVLSFLMNIYPKKQIWPQYFHFKFNSIPMNINIKWIEDHLSAFFLNRSTSCSSPPHHLFPTNVNSTYTPQRWWWIMIDGDSTQRELVVTLLFASSSAFSPQ